MNLGSETSAANVLATRFAGKHKRGPSFCLCSGTKGWLRPIYHALLWHALGQLKWRKLMLALCLRKQSLVYNSKQSLTHSQQHLPERRVACERNKLYVHAI